MRRRRKGREGEEEGENIPIQQIFRISRGFNFAYEV